MNRISLAWMLASALLFCACGDDDGPGDGTASSAFVILSPQAGEVLAGRVQLRIAALDDTLTSFDVSHEGSVLGRDGLRSDGFEVSFPASDLANGDVTLLVEAFAGGRSLGRSALGVRVIANPPSVADIGPEGGALRTDSGIVVILPPGALDETHGFMVRDRDPATLPLDLWERGFEVLSAVDFTLDDGTIDPTLIFNRPAVLQYPFDSGSAEAPTGAARGALYSAGELELFAFRPDATGDGQPQLDYVTGARASGDMAISVLSDPPVVTGLENITAPGEPLRPYDLARIVGINLPRTGGDLLVRVGSRVPQQAYFNVEWDQPFFLVPPGSEGADVTVRVGNRWAPGEAVVRVAIEPRAEPAPSIEEADRLVGLLFDDIDAGLADLTSASFGGGSDPRIERMTAVLATVESFDDPPVARWRVLMDRMRADLLASPEEARVSYGRQLVTLETNRALLTGTAPGALSSAHFVKCQVTAMVGLWFAWMSLPINLTPTAFPGSLATGAGSGAAACAFIDSMVKMGCYGNMDARSKGVTGCECDVLTRSTTAPLGAASILETDVFELGQESVDRDDGEMVDVPTYRPASGRVVEAHSGADPAAPPIVDSTVDYRGAVTVPYDGTEDEGEVTVRDGDGAVVVSIPISVPEEGTVEYCALVVPGGTSTVDPGATPPTGTVFSVRSGLEAGLASDTNTYRTISTGDFDGDGLVDFYFNAGYVDRSPMMTFDDVRMRYLGRNLGGANFEVVEWQHDLLAGYFAIPYDVSAPVDIDLDGNLDILVFDQNNPLASPHLDIYRGLGSGSFTYELLEALPVGDCGPANGVAIGDFVSGGGPDILILATPTATSAVGDALTGTQCLLVNGGAGTFTTVRQAGLPRRGFLDQTTGLTVDLDGDGHLDAWFPRLGIVAFGDGAGAFSEVTIGADCYDPTRSGLLSPNHSAPASSLDHDGDGLPDLWMPQALTPRGTGHCLLTNNGDRTFAGRELEFAFHPADGACENDWCYQVWPADVDNDGAEDLILTANSSATVAYRRADTYAEAESVELTANVNAVTSSDVDGDGATDIMLGTSAVGGTGDVLLHNNASFPGRAISVVLGTIRSPGESHGARVEVDLDDDGDFSPAGALAVRTYIASELHVGIGAAAAVDVRVTFPGGGISAASVVTRLDVAPGTRLTIDDPR